jgi:hypothetical protein
VYCNVGMNAARVVAVARQFASKHALCARSGGRNTRQTAGKRIAATVEIPHEWIRQRYAHADASAPSQARPARRQCPASSRREPVSHQLEADNERVRVPILIIDSIDPTGEQRE